MLGKGLYSPEESSDMHASLLLCVSLVSLLGAPLGSMPARALELQTAVPAAIATSSDAGPEYSPVPSRSPRRAAKSKDDPILMGMAKRRFSRSYEVIPLCVSTLNSMKNARKGQRE
jgi:hypothetical protein